MLSQSYPYSKFDLQSWTKYLEENKEIKQNWTAAESFDNCLYVAFEHYYKGFKFER